MEGVREFQILHVNEIESFNQIIKKNKDDNIHK